MASMALAFDILARDKASGAFDSAGRSADGFSGKLSNVGRIAKTAIAGTAIGAIAGLGTAMVGGLKDAVNYETLQNKTAAVLKSTGNAANTSVKGIQNLAGKLENLSGVDEELIINSQNVLATFTKVRNETGKGNKVFDDAAKAALNVSVALGTDLQSASTMVGKALNDPIAGLTAMSKAGIQFTDEQKTLIRTLVESGDQLGAQKIILGELETQFGGVAEAAGSGLAGDMARLKDSLSDVFREIGTALLPTLTDLAAWLSASLPGAIEAAKTGLNGLKEWWDTNGPAVMGVVNALKEGVQMAFGAIIEAGAFVIEHWDQFKIVAIGLAALIIGHYVALGVAAVASAAMQAGAWATASAAATKHAAIISAAWLRAAGPLGLVIGGAAWVAEQGPDAPGGHTGIDRWLNPFDGLSVDLPSVDPRDWFDDGGVVSGPRGVHRPVWAAGGETILPTHKSGFQFDAVGEDQLLELRTNNGLLEEQNGILRAMAGGSIAHSRAAAVLR